MRILIADKDPELRALVATRLSVRRYEIAECPSSEDALRELERQNVDLILLSAEMERVGEKMLIEKIREKPHLATLPIILMTEEDKITDLIMSQERGYDDFLIKPFSPLALQLRVALNISRSRQRADANALTHLPGNHAVERVIRAKIDRGEKFSVLYIDLNHFKSFNDRYSFEKGDDVILHTAKLLVQTAEAVLGGQDEYFIGHIGGDDFVVVLSPDKEESYARAFMAEFDRIMPTYYNEADQKQGFIRVANRRGKRENFPLISCSVAACNNLHRVYKSLGEIAQDASEVKAFLKSQPGSHYLRDRRSEPLRALDEAIEILAPEVEEEGRKAQQGVDPLGQVLLGAGLITREELSLALKRHFETGQRLGQTLIAMNAVKSEEVGRMLEKKLNVPYVSLKHFIPARASLRIFTFEFMKAHRVVPLEKAGEGLKLAMCDPFDLKTLDAIEGITGMKPIPCLALEAEFEEFLERCTKESLREEKIG